MSCSNKNSSQFVIHILNCATLPIKKDVHKQEGHQVYLHNEITSDALSRINYNPRVVICYFCRDQLYNASTCIYQISKVYGLWFLERRVKRFFLTDLASLVKPIFTTGVSFV